MSLVTEVIKLVGEFGNSYQLPVALVDAQERAGNDLARWGQLSHRFRATAA
jgi:hypothetical protein